MFFASGNIKGLGETKVTLSLGASHPVLIVIPPIPIGFRLEDDVSLLVVQNSLAP